ncbi:twin-arginine translocase subunit TatC [Larkinella rosea]|uniref:Sec-independent protein translocase protein TatC n=1 Tax=Larkinella rosea TaxID=2025312 RepID=A0A3P1BET6_9BACT|nr:twin-arginine translocase subunit TatC [Larkinella rosea]RRA99173.1 twin-arginine translocase subunit TatC [Larkinella rosea]
MKPIDQEFDSENEVEEGEMTFLEHLEELRWHIVRAIGSIAIFAVLAFIFIREIYDSVILAPSKTDFWTYRMMCILSKKTGFADLCIEKLNFTLQSREMAGQFTTALTSSLMVGLLFAFPYAFWELWRFIMPGLKLSERRAARGAVFYVTTLFMLGVLFGYYIVSPLAINFLANYQLDPSIVNEFDITSYISTLATLTLGCALTFQMPIVAFVLSKVGILTPKFMREYRRHALVVILVVAAIITPSPDVYSQILVAIPLVLLYEVSIWVSGYVQRLRLKEEQALMKTDGYED